MAGLVNFPDEDLGATSTRESASRAFIVKLTWRPRHESDFSEHRPKSPLRCSSRSIDERTSSDWCDRLSPHEDDRFHPSQSRQSPAISH
jgi:hypothetical protein